MATFWEKAAHSIHHMFSLCFDYITCFGFECWIWLLIASVPGLCILFTFIVQFKLVLAMVPFLLGYLLDLMLPLFFKTKCVKNDNTSVL